MVFLNGMLLVEGSDYFKDHQTITFDSSVNALPRILLRLSSLLCSSGFVFNKIAQASEGEEGLDLCLL